MYNKILSHELAKISQAKLNELGKSLRDKKLALNLLL